MEKLKHFFWLCSGVHIPLLKKCEIESSRYTGIGATIFFTGIFAALAASYALYTVFDNGWVAAAFGLVWGLMIFNLDRYIVSSMRKDGNTWREIRTAAPRIVLAVLISLVIAKPLELKIFAKEIGGELVIMEQQTYTAQENEIRMRYQSDQEVLKSEIATLKAEVVAKTAKRDELNHLAQEEADGTGGTKKRNAGPIYKIKKADADQANRELEELQQKNDRLIRSKLTQLQTADSTISTQINGLAKQKLDGPASRMEALDRLMAGSDAIFWANWFIVLLFIVVETAPLFVKLISSQGPYDHLLKVEEHGFDTSRIEEMAKINAAIKARTAELPKTESTYITDRLDVRLNESS
ncbi:MAG TPA: DUF4407 domain-containing protein [Chryseolinea sp.]|nr:DUF4407 domain-containing protein [Chryseolinea sp.]